MQSGLSGLLYLPITRKEPRMITITEHELTVAIEALEEGVFQLDLRAKDLHPIGSKLTIQAFYDIIKRFKQVGNTLKEKAI